MNLRVFKYLVKQCFLSACFGCTLLLLFPTTTEAIVFNGGAGTTDFNDPNNWENNTIPGTNPLPGSATEVDDAVIGQVGTSDPNNGGDGQAYQNPAVVDLNGPVAVANTFRDLRIGNGDGGDGTLNHSAGTLNTSGNWAFIGANGSASNPSVGRYNLSGSAIFNNTPALLVGTEGGPHPDPNNRNEGYITVSGNALMEVGAVNLGHNNGGYGQLDQTGGTVEVANWFNIGENDAEGEYNISGGSLNVFSELNVGQNGGAKGALNISGTAQLDIENFRVGRDDATGVVSITGSTASIIATSLQMGYNSAGAGNETIAKGTLSFTSDSGGVTPIEVTDSVWLNDLGIAGDFDLDGTVTGLDFLLWQTDPNVGDLSDYEANYGLSEGSASLVVDLTTNAPPLGDILLVDNQSLTAINGSFEGLPEGAFVPNSGGRAITYVYGAGGNDIALIPIPLLNAVPEPSCIVIAFSMVMSTMGRRYRT